MCRFQISLYFIFRTGSRSHYQKHVEKKGHREKIELNLKVPVLLRLFLDVDNYFNNWQ
jgi:hypothetical protein